jgi:hypothetical protein
VETNLPKSKGHIYIPNSVPEIKQGMMREIGIKSTDELYAGSTGAYDALKDRLAQLQEI